MLQCTSVGCDCTSFSPNAHKKTVCNNCFHKRNFHVDVENEIPMTDSVPLHAHETPSSQSQSHSSPTHDNLNAHDTPSSQSHSHYSSTHDNLSSTELYVPDPSPPSTTPEPYCEPSPSPSSPDQYSSLRPSLMMDRQPSFSLSQPPSIDDVVGTLPGDGSIPVGSLVARFLNDDGDAIERGKIICLVDDGAMQYRHLVVWDDKSLSALDKAVTYEARKLHLSRDQASCRGHLNQSTPSIIPSGAGRDKKNVNRSSSNVNNSRSRRTSAKQEEGATAGREMSTSRPRGGGASTVADRIAKLQMKSAANHPLATSCSPELSDARRRRDIEASRQNAQRFQNSTVQGRQQQRPQEDQRPQKTTPPPPPPGGRAQGPSEGQWSQQTMHPPPGGRTQGHNPYTPPAPMAQEQDQNPYPPPSAGAQGQNPYPASPPQIQPQQKWWMWSKKRS